MRASESSEKWTDTLIQYIIYLNSLHPCIQLFHHNVYRTDMHRWWKKWRNNFSTGAFIRRAPVRCLWLITPGMLWAICCTLFWAISYQWRRTRVSFGICAKGAEEHGNLWKSMIFFWCEKSWCLLDRPKFSLVEWIQHASRNCFPFLRSILYVTLLN